jgi:spore germination protein YaaH
LAALLLLGPIGLRPALAADPAAGGPLVPPALPNAPVTLQDGTVLPLPPPGAPLLDPVHADIAAEHDDDELTFVPGAPPTVPLATGAGSRSAQAAAAGLPNGLRREVLGFLPYWMLDASDLQWMQYQRVSTIAYFGVAARSDGTLATYATGWSGWYSSAMTDVINAAHARGVRVVLTITMMAYDGGAQQAALLGSATARANVIAAIVAAVRDRNADGVNLDFEPVAVAQRDQYTSFVRQLKAALVAAGVGSHLTVCTMAGAATWATGYDLAGLVAPGGADALFVMGYDFSWSGSARAGGVAPMSSPYMLDVSESMTDYLEQVAPNRIIWGVPYYGRAWRTQSNVLNAPTQPGSSGASVAYWYTANLSLAAQHGRQWDPVGQVPWFRYYDSTAASWVEAYYDDTVSLAAKWDLVNQRGLLGTGMWTLLMDAGRAELWNLLDIKFGQGTAIVGQATFNPTRPVSFAAGTHTGFGYNAAGQVTATKTYTLAAASSAAATGEATVNGAHHVLIANGVWAGYWIPTSSRVVLGQAPSPPQPPQPPPPPPDGTLNPPGSLQFSSGAHTGYQFGAAGQVTASKTYSLGAASSASASRRTTLPGRTGHWFLVTNGVWAGFWIQESVRAHLAGFLDREDFGSPRAVSFAAGAHTGLAFTASGGVSGARTYVLARPSSASATARAVINGVTYVLISNGVWAGYWVPVSSRVVLS